MGNRGSIEVVVVTKKERWLNAGKNIALYRHWQGSPEAMIELVERAWNETKYRTRYPGELLALLTRYAVEEDGYSAYIGDHGDDSDNGRYSLVISCSSWASTEADVKREWKLKHNGGVVWERVE
jgi:hypothetical protein